MVALLVPATAAEASGRLKLGLYEEALIFSNPDQAFATLAELRPQVLRLNLEWDKVASVRPIDPANPLDQAYNWSRYDSAATRAQQIGAELLLHVIGTPPWANGGRPRQYAPDAMLDLHSFTLAAARRYSGVPLANGQVFPAVGKWGAWNEPNLATYLRPTWRRINSRLVPVGARTYARICTTIWQAVHQAAAEAVRPVKVACGVTAPYARGGSGISPLRFLREMKRAKARFDVYAHHPYARRRSESPTSLPVNRAKTVSLGNIGDLFRELTRLYGKKKKLWITEYAYQTNPPDPFIGVSWSRQAAWMKQAHAIMRRHRRIDMMIWFLVQDEPDPNGSAFGVDRWQSGVIDVNGVRKPSFTTFQNLPRL